MSNNELQTKARRPYFFQGSPPITEGKDGDFAISITEKGLSLYCKYNNTWYRVNALETAISKGGGKPISLEDKEFKSVKATSVVGDLTGNATTATIAAKATKLNTTDNGIVKTTSSDGTIASGVLVSGDIVNNGADTTGNAATATLAVKATGINTTSNGFVKTGSSNGTISVGALVSDDIPDNAADTSGTAAAATLAAKATGINTTSNGFVKTGSSNGTVSVSANVDLASDVTGNLPNGNLANDSISLGGVSVDLGSSDDTPAFDLSDSTNTNLDSIKSGTQIAAANVSDFDTEVGNNTTVAGKANLAGASFTGDVKFQTIAGFQHVAEETINTTGDLTVDFNDNNKRRIRFYANSVTINNLRMYFPDQVSGSFILVVKNSAALGSGVTDSAIGTWKVYNGETAAGHAANQTDVIWHGGSSKKPTISTTANKVDIFSFYWDSEEEICYGQSGIGFSA